MDPLRIFISHKMPTDTALAETIAAKLSLYAGAQIKISHAGKFRYGEDWRRKIQDELTAANWVIFLHTDQDEDWGFCLFELGYFRKAMDTDPTKRLITFCRRPEQLSDAIKEFEAKVISASSVGELLEDMYLKEPWRLSPGLGASHIESTAKDIVGAFLGSERVGQNFDVATSVMIELALTDVARQSLKNNVLPAEAALSGTRDWQSVFGLDIDTGGWQWAQLTELWPHAEIYGFLIATMIDDALDSRMPKGTLLAVRDQLYRMTLRRYESLAGNDKHRFYFTLAPADVPFEVNTDASGRNSIIALYHLMNVAWFFRRRIVDQIYERLLEMATQPAPNVRELTNIYDQLGRELMQLSAQALIRQIDSPLTVLRALGSEDPDVRAFVEELRNARTFRLQVYAGMSAGVEGLHGILEALSALASLNHRFLLQTAKRFASAAEELPDPPKPVERFAPLPQAPTAKVARAGS